jgi:hypothetical protein
LNRLLVDDVIEYDRKIMVNGRTLVIRAGGYILSSIRQRAFLRVSGFVQLLVMRQRINAAPLNNNQIEALDTAITNYETNPLSLA